MCNNCLTEVDDSLRHLRALHTLDLSHNKISVLTDDLIAEKLELADLDLSFNQIEAIDRSVVVSSDAFVR